MDFIGLAIAIAQAVAAFFGATGHFGTVCLNVPVAIHAPGNSGVELSPTIRGSLIGQVPSC